MTVNIHLPVATTRCRECCWSIHISWNCQWHTTCFCTGCKMQIPIMSLVTYSIRNIL